MKQVKFFRKKQILQFSSSINVVAEDFACVANDVMGSILGYHRPVQIQVGFQIH